MKSLSVFLSSLVLTASVALAEVQTYEIDVAHSRVGFKVNHFFTPVSGHFSDFEGKIEYDPSNLEASKVKATIEVASIFTDNQKRDDHLRSDDYFDAEEFPQITFSSTKWERKGENKYAVTGDFKMRDIEKEVTLDVTLLGVGDNPRGGTVSGWLVKTTLDRTHFGITAGQPVVSPTVEVEIAIEGLGK